MQIQLSSTTAVSPRRNRRWLVGTLITVLFLGLFAIQASAQQATIVGTVTDPSGAAVPNAKITVTELETGVVRRLATNGQGQYVVPNLPIGRYTVEVDAQGFKHVEQKNVTLEVGDRDRFDFKLQLGSATEQVTVEAESVGVQTETGEVSNVISGKQVENLATNGRSIYSLVNLTTGASSLQTDFQVPTPIGGDAAVSFNGQRPGHNLYMVDGGEDYDRGSGGTFGIMPSLESIAEFRQLTSNYSAQYGLSSAATMTTVLKSGTKTFHASAWEYLRNDALDARNYFNPAPNPIAELRYNTFGFNAGGQVPIAKEHPTFFFYNMEWRKLRQGGNYNVTVPLPSTYGGNLGATNITVPNNVAPAVLFRNCPGGVAPAGINPGDPFPNNTIPTCMLDSNAQSMLNAGIFPAPTNGTQFQGTPATPTDVREEIARIDHQFNDKFSIFGHWVSEQISQGFGTTIWSGDNVPTIGTTFGNPSYSAVVHATYIISPKLLNETAFNYNGNRIHITPVGIYAAPSDFTFNRVYTGPNPLDRMPSIALNNTGTNYQSNWMPWNNKANSYQIRDDISWSKGAHQLKFGGSWELYSKIQDLFAPTQGAFNFNGRFTGNDFADFLLGLSNSYSENAVQDSGHWNATSWALYIQDDWRATNRLTLNLGLRWDGIPHTVEVNGRESNFYPSLYDPSQAPTFYTDPVTGVINYNQIDPSSPGLGTSPNPILAGYKFYMNGLGVAGQNGTPKGLVSNHWGTFGPRLGFSYDLTGNGTTVVRGGFGIMYERVQGNDMYNAATNPPFSGSVTLNNVSLSNPQLDVTNGATLNTATLPILVNSLSGLNANNYKHPTVYQYSFGFQRSITSKAVWSIAYVGSQNRHQSDYREIELPPYDMLPMLIADPTAYNTDVPYAGFHSIRLANNEANGHYNSLQTSVSGQVTKDLYLSTGYTFSRSIDPLNANGGNSGGDLGNVSNPYVGWRYDIGPSPFDRTHIFFANYVYSIPFFRNASSHLARTLAGGWQLSGIVNIQSGAPLNITTGGPTSVCSVIPNCTNRPDLVSSVTYPHTVAEWFSTSSFAVPATGTWGTLRNDALRGPSRFNWNMSLFKSFVFSESRGSRLEFRADAFNVFNHTQFGAAGANGGVSTNLQAPNFGQITSAFEPRVFQLGAKLVF